MIAELALGLLTGAAVYSRGLVRGYRAGHDQGYADASCDSADAITDAFDQGHASAFDAIRAAAGEPSREPTNVVHLAAQRDAGRRRTQ